MSWIKKQFDFISLAAHEFRTPLNIAIFCIEDLLLDPKLSKTNLKKIKKLSNSLEWLKTLVSKYLQVKQFNLNKIVLEKNKIEINLLIRNFIKEISPISNKKLINFEFKKSNKECFLNIDKIRFIQIIDNLISNAIRFSKKNWRIIINCIEKKSFVRIEVIDNWPWVLKDEKKDIFKIFKSKKYLSWSWFWFWLFLCKKIVLLHKWKIWVINNKDWWAIFYFELPK